VIAAVGERICWVFRKTAPDPFVLAVLLTVATVGMAVFWRGMEPEGVVEVWAGPAVIPSTVLLYGMCTWSVLAVVGAVVSALLNGMHIVTFQVGNIQTRTGRCRRERVS